MKKQQHRLNIFFSTFFCLLAMSACDANKTSAEKQIPENAIRIGVQPNESSLDFTPLQKELSARIAQPVVFISSESYADLVEKFKNKKVDFAFFTGITFIQAEKDAGAKVLLKKVYGETEFYYSAIVVPKKSPLKTIEDFKKKSAEIKFAFVDPKSTSGYLYPRVMLRAVGIDAGPDGNETDYKMLKHVFAGTHDKAVAALIAGEAQAAGVWADEPSMKTGAWSQGDMKADVRVLEYSAPIPNDAFVVRQDYFKEKPLLVYKVMEAMIGLEDAVGKPLKSVLDVDRMATATSRHYDSVRILAKLLNDVKQ